MNELHTKAGDCVYLMPLRSLPFFKTHFKTMDMLYLYYHCLFCVKSVDNAKGLHSVFAFICRTVFCESRGHTSEQGVQMTARDCNTRNQ